MDECPYAAKRESMNCIFLDFWQQKGDQNKKTKEGKKTETVAENNVAFNTHMYLYKLDFIYGAPLT